MRWLRLVLLCASFSALALGCATDADDPGDGDDGALVDGGIQGPGGDIPFMGACEISNDQCATGEQCFEYGEGGMYCSHECTSDAQCPAPSRGCNNKGICKRP